MVTIGVIYGSFVLIKVDTHKVLTVYKACDRDGDARAGIVGGRANSTKHASLDWVVEAAHDVGWMGMHLAGMDVLRYTVVMAGWGKST